MPEILLNPFVHLLVIALLFSVATAAASIAPWIPTSKKDLERINRIADLKPGQTFYEIGCGNGRVCSYIAQKNPQANVIGCELAFPFFLFCFARRIFFGPKNLEIRWKNAFRENLGETDVIYIFGLSRALNGTLRKKMRSEMKSGARLISYVFSLETWGNNVSADKTEISPNAIYTYRQP